MDRKFIEILADILDVSAESIAEVDKLVLDPEDNWDSIAILSAISVIDDEYEIQLDGDELQICESASDLYTLIQNKS